MKPELRDHIALCLYNTAAQAHKLPPVKSLETLSPSSLATWRAEADKILTPPPTREERARKIAAEACLKHGFPETANRLLDNGELWGSIDKLVVELTLCSIPED